MISTEIQQAIYSALIAGTPLCGGRVYDSVPENPTFPYITIGEENTVDDGNTCDDGWDVYADVHVWSRGVGFPEAKRVMAEARDRLAGIWAISGHTLIAAEVERTGVFRDPDGLTSHGVLSVKFIITPA